MQFLLLGCRGKRLCLFLITTCLCLNGFSQLSEPGIPESFLVKLKATAIIPQKNLEVINIQNFIAEDLKYSIPNRYGTVQHVDIDLKSAGVKTLINGKGTIWQYKILSTNAYSLGIYFRKFNLAAGAKVFIYDESHKQLLGAFTDIDNNPEQQLAIAEFTGSNAIIEYFEPSSSQFSGELVIGSVSQAYKDIQSILSSTPARIGINCPAGVNWQDEKHAVCRMIFNDTQYSYYCTGFLVNNVRQDGTPYFQTANHCISTAAEAQTLVTYFNYENSTCSGNDAASNVKTLSGASLKATNKYSDFSLLQLDQVPPTTYNAYYAGWNASGVRPTAGTCIHHPEGTPKCISLQNTSAPISYNGSIRWDNNYTSSANTHWEISFDQGNVEGGSSGSPLFDQNKRIIGQLHGGDTTYSYYGKYSLSWNYGSSSNTQLKTWLDPDNTGVLITDGSYMRVKPKTAFSTALTSVCVGTTIQITDQSKNNPTQWKWKIFPSTYSYVNGTDSSSKSPSVIFNNENDYSVSLITTNSYGTDSTAKNDYILAKNSIRVSMNNIPVDSILCGSIVTKYPIKANGALQYSFTLDNANKLNYSVNNDSIYLTLKSGIEKDGSFTAWLKVGGTFGTCKSADSAKLKVVMQTNNDIANAIRIWPGRNATISNQCATSQSKEPHAPYTACYSNSSWCNSPTNSLKNTVWFTFIGPSTGLVTIDTHGLNNKIAVYSADSYNDIVSGNTNSYKILAANEGRSAVDATSKIEDLSVEAGKLYWLQVDGSNGSVGNCTIDLVCNNLSVFPNPSDGHFDVIVSNENNGTAVIEIYSLTGKLLLKKQLKITSESNRFSFDASDYASGMYMLKTTVNGSTLKTKLMIIRDK